MSMLYSQTEIRELEQLAITHGINATELMARAGGATFALLQRHYKEAKAILILCGGGNNGGDGYVLAKLAHEAGLNIYVRFVGDLKKLKGEALNACKACRKAKINIAPWDSEERLVIDLIVDAMVGIGLKGELKPEIMQVIEIVNQADIPVLAIDVPSGLLVDTGDIAGNAIKADSTITFIGIKLGMLTACGPEYCGALFSYDLGLPEELFEQVSHSAVAIDLEVFENCFGLRPRSAHKGDFGHVLIVGGAPGMSGAPLLSALAAVRVGAGLVSIATHSQHAAFLNINNPEIMCHGVSSKYELKDLLAKASVVVIGPGLGTSDWSKQLFETALSTNLPLIVDADALNLLSQAPQKHDNWVLTPHPGEAARLLKVKTKTIQWDRFQAVKNLRKKYHAIVVLKGSGTVIGSEVEPLVCSGGNPGMASGGMGDLLSGVIAGIVAQGKELSFAAALGVCLHATAADKVALKKGERGLLATDLLPYLTKLINRL
ncbi:MAG: hypothetical protein A3E87_07030 [Gammaproteobacteria bacterium RIFCSPHIGHO2_12_FULL_35_23]|nr:MAG: hypothetical protein A3E87_07030 [Gammaproteobacteria bacterium RIFCSPHIGHO2_12_FULL_35_23]